MSIANLPTARIKCGQPFNADLFFEMNGAAVDLTGWSARFSIATAFLDPAIIETAPTLTNSGFILIALTDEQTLTLQPYAGSCLVFQIDIALGAEAHRMQGKVQIFPEIPT